MTTDIVVNSIAAALWSILTLAFVAILKRFKQRGQREFWAPFLKGNTPLHVVLTDKAGTKSKSPRKISITDVRAYSEFRSVLNTLGKKVEICAGSEIDINQLKKNSFISLGGPVANGISDLVMRVLDGRLRVKYHSNNPHFVLAGNMYSADYDTKGMVIRDYGVVIRLQKLDKRDINSKPVLVAFGLHGHGTEQTVKAISSNSDLVRQLKQYRNLDVFALLKFDFEDHKFRNSELITVGQID